MGKSLSEIDTLYKQTVSKLPATQRTDYCEHYIDKAQHILEKNGKYFDKKQKEQLREMIQAAQKEIGVINKE